MEKIKTFEELRSEFGETDEEEIDIRNEVLDDCADKINEIIDYLRGKNEFNNRFNSNIKHLRRTKKSKFNL